MSLTPEGGFLARLRRFMTQFNEFLIRSDNFLDRFTIDKWPVLFGFRAPESDEQRSAKNHPPATEPGKGTLLLAWRLETAMKSVVKLLTPWLLVPGVALVLVALPSSFSGDPGSIVVLVFGILCTASAFGMRRVPVVWPEIPDGPEGYAHSTRAIEISNNWLERVHVYFGTLHDSARTAPALVHEELLKMHMLTLGASGRNKTHRGVIPICCQLLRMWNRSLVYIDLKGDDAAFQILRGQSECLRIPIYYFSLDPNEASCLMNLLNDPAFRSLSDNQQAQLIAQAAGLEAGEAFGASFFSAMIEILFKRVFAYFRKTGQPLSFVAARDLGAHPAARRLLGMNRRDFEAASHALAIFDKLADEPRLNAVGDEGLDPSFYENAITVDKVIQSPCIVYLKLSALAEPTTARVVARLFPRLLISRLMSWHGDRVHHIYTVVDEAQEMLQRGLLTPIKQVRSLGMSFNFVLQNLSDLKRDGFDFTDVILNNTAVKLMMSAKDREGRFYLTASGGEKLRELTSSSQLNTTTPNGENVGIGQQTHQSIVPVFGPDELNYINARTELAVLEASPMSGFSRFERPTIIDLPFPMSKTDFDAFAAMGWPLPDGWSSLLASDVVLVKAPVLVPPQPASTTRRMPSDASQPEASGLRQSDEMTARPRPKRRRPPKPVDPKEAERAAQLAETLRRLGGK